MTEVGRWDAWAKKTDKSEKIRTWTSATIRTLLKRVDNLEKQLTINKWEKDITEIQDPLPVWYDDQNRGEEGAAVRLPSSCGSSVPG